MYLIRALNVFKVWYCLEILLIMLSKFKQICIKLINLKCIKVLFNVKAN